jgi:phosphoglycolate phosphatase-like HAD superfamily hydrolase
MPRLVLFDIDGTLVLTGGAGVRAMNRAFEATFEVPDAFAGIALAGRTDRIILADALERWRVEHDEAIAARFRDTYYGYLAEEVEKPGPRKGVLPGVRGLLAALAGLDGVFLALLTGNYSRAAQIKLEHFDLWQYFACGAFGEDAHDRNHLVEIAVSRARAHGAPAVPPSDVLIVGDTPLDVACARAGGARPIAVATGSHTVDELRESGAEVVFSDLTDRRRFLDLLG